MDAIPTNVKPLCFSNDNHIVTKGNGKRLFINKEVVVVPPYVHVLEMVAPKLQRGNSLKHEERDDRAHILVEVVVPFVVPRFT